MKDAKDAGEEARKEPILSPTTSVSNGFACAVVVGTTGAEI
jgi:hypothetical protein